jgi:hypothetical protein
VSEGDILKEYGSRGKQTRILRSENDQMRDILVTPDNAGGREMFRVGHIEPVAALRKPQRHPQCPSVDGCGGLHQTAANVQEIRD